MQIIYKNNQMISQELDNNEEIEVLYNECYGSWKISDKAKELYIFRKSNNELIENNIYLSKRNDPNIIQIYYELGEEFNGKNCRTNIRKISKKYENYYYIDQYDGFESVEIDYIKYELDNLKKNIKEILEDNSINNYKKINQIKKIII